MNRYNVPRKTAVIACLVFALAFPRVWAAERASIQILGNLLMPADENYKQIYGSSVFFPELRLNLVIGNGVFLWAGGSYVGASGKTPVLEETATSSQWLITGGAGYKIEATPKLSVDVRIGVLFANFKEETMGLEVSDSALGWALSGGFAYGITKAAFLNLEAGYLSASKTIDAEEVKIGGFKLGAGLGLKF